MVKGPLDEHWDAIKHEPLSMVAKVASIQTQLMINNYSYQDVARLIAVKMTEDDDETEDEDESEEDEESDESSGEERYLEAIKSDDPLAELLVESEEDEESDESTGLGRPQRKQI